MRLFRAVGLRRRPVVFWGLTLLLAGLTWSAVSSAVGSAAAVRRSWGATVPAVVVRRFVAVGSVVPPSAVGVVRMPARFVPGGAAGASAVSGVVGRVALADLWPGEVVLRARLAPEGLRGVAALVPTGMRAVAVPVGDASVRVAVGDRVDVLASVDNRPTVTLAEDALVVDVRDGSVTLAVTPAAAAKVAYASTHTTPTLALSTRQSTGTGPVENQGEGR